MRTLAAMLMLASVVPHEGVVAKDHSISVTSSAREFTRSPSTSLPPRLTFLGGITLESGGKDFGGFSGLEVSRDGKRFLAVSDRGNWLSGKFVYTDGKLSGVRDTQMAPILNSKGKAEHRKSRADAEAVAAWSNKGLDGKIIVGFERRERVERYNFRKHGFDAKPKRVKSPKALSSGQKNGELEALGRFAEGPLKGWLVAISERNQAKDDSLRGWLWRNSKTLEFHIPQHEDYRITGLAILPGGKEIITVERSFRAPVFVGMAMRRIAVDGLQKPNTGPGELLFAGRISSYKIDNMEGIAAHEDERGTVLTVISDDNFNRSIQSTVIFQFRLNPN
jgi:hypothetical protein